jgi:hypothetical protein
MPLVRHSDEGQNPAKFCKANQFSDDSMIDEIQLGFHSTDLFSQHLWPCKALIASARLYIWEVLAARFSSTVMRTITK